jgi:long-subunit acyl-CoA synthetase (AMP-forming)
MKESFLKDGFFKTGDEAVIDDQDRVRITGRI